jgi:ribosomal protein S18 acetylase RimI-like enzyme
MTISELGALNLRISIRFRFAIEADLPKLEWGGEFAHFRRVLRNTYHEQQHGNRLMLLADLNGYPIGQIFIHLESLDRLLWQMQKRAYLYSFRVMPPFRGLGVGTALMAEVEKLLAERRFTQMSIAVAKENDGALRLYQKLGFSISGEDSGRWSYVDHEGRTRHVAEPCWLLEKNLPNVGSQP